MTSQFEATIAELRHRRDKIDSAIAALEELNGEAPGKAGGGAVQTRITAGRKTESAKPTGKTKAHAFNRSVGKGAVGKGTKGATNYERVLAVLKSGPKRSGAVISALNGKVKAASVYTVLNHLKSRGQVKVKEDKSYELVN